MVSGQYLAHRREHFLISGRTTDAQHLGVTGADTVRVIASSHTSGNQYAPVLTNGFADGFQTLLFGGVNESAGVDDNDPGILIVRRDVIALHSELRENAL